MITDLKKKSVFWVKNDFGFFFEKLTIFGRKKRLDGKYKKKEGNDLTLPKELKFKRTENETRKCLDETHQSA